MTQKILNALACGQGNCPCSASVRRGKGLTHCCSHPDPTPSLNVEPGRNVDVVVTCHGGCDQQVVIAELKERGLWGTPVNTGVPFQPQTQREVAIYDYTDRDGNPLYSVVRYEPKTFRQRRADGTWNMEGVERVLYQLPELVNAVAAGETVYVVEGERDVETLRSLGLVATCNSGGAGKWIDKFSLDFINAHVVVIADADEPGRKHAREVAESLALATRSLKVIELPKKDVSDFVAAGGRAVEIAAIAERTMAWDNQILTGKDLVSMYSDAMARKMSGDPDYVGIETGLGELDKHISYRPGDLWLVVAATGVGKSALLATMQSDLDSRGVPSLMVSLEMSWIVIVERLINSGLTLEQIGERVGLLVDEPSLSIERLETLAKIAKLRGARVLFVDYAQRMVSDQDSEYERVSAISNGLARIARETRLCIVAAAQVSRQGAGRDGQPPRLSEIRASGHLEQDAAVVLAIGRKTGESATTLQIQKNRHGQVATLRVEFDPAHGRFITGASEKAETRNWTPREADPMEIPF